MLRVSGFEFVVRILPEAFIFMFAAYAFSKTKIDKRKYFISSIILGLCVFLIRMLPINYGVHTILNIITLPILCNLINKINIVESTKVSIIISILLFVLEGLNVVLLNMIFGESLTEIMTNNTLKTIYGLPSLVLLFSIVTIYYKHLVKKDKFKYA